MGIQGGANKPHVVCVPYPLQGHIVPMLQLAKLLHHKGFHVTFVNTEFNHKRILDSRGPDALHGLPDFRFETIPIEHPQSNSHTILAHNLHALRESCRKNFLDPFRGLLKKLNDNATAYNVSPVTCVVADQVLTHAVMAAQELGVPSVLLCTMSASGFMGFKEQRDLMKRLAALRDASDDQSDELDTPVDWIPGMKGARLRDVLKVIKAKDPKEFMDDSGDRELERASKASAMIFHTFCSLETKQMDGLSPMFQKAYSIGPLPLLLKTIDPEDRYKSIDCSLWNKESECIQWLNSKEPSSVIYVNFGSTIVMSTKELLELAWGLANSNQQFLWILRPDLILGDTAVLPQEFLSEIKERGLLASWCPQEQVLNHPSIGGFVTHCGWNSTLEGISAGLPMICLPFFGDQYTNCKYSCKEWGVGVQLSDNFERREVENLVREVMEVGDKGKKIKDKVLEWKTMAQEAASSVGSSSSNLDNLVNQVLLSN